MRKAICVFLVSIFVGNSVLYAAGGKPILSHPQQTDDSPQPKLKQKVVETPVQTMVEVRLRSKEKLRGRLGEVSDEGFALKVAQGNKIEDRQVAFADLKSFKAVEGKGTSKGPWIVLGVLAGVGATFLVIFLILAHSE